MLFAMSIGFLSAFVVLIVQARLGLKKFMGYPALMDACVTLLIAWLLHGTFAGMTAAAFGGLFYSLAITVIRKAYGYAKLERHGLRIQWVEYEGTWTTDIKARFNNLLKETTLCWKPRLSNLPLLVIAGWLILACVA